VRSSINPFRDAVRRQSAPYHVRFLLISFAATVAVTRLYLTLTGFPQLGSQTLHIAHLLWGGLLLFISVILIVIFANRRIYTLGAILGGVGVGLFIDEVGKFITRTNDYFFPAAAPIIYTLVLLVVLIYLEVRRPPKNDTRSELYRVFESLHEVLDRDLDPKERAALEASLRNIHSRAEHADFKRLAQDLLYFVNSKAVVLVRPKHVGIDRIARRWSTFANHWLSQSRLKAIVVGGVVAVGIWSILDRLTLIPFFASPTSLQREMLSLASAGRLTGSTSLYWFLGDIALKGARGLILLIGAGLMIARREKQGLIFSYMGLLFLITVVDLLEFYFDQFGTILPAAFHFGLLVTLLYYRRKSDW
jgi:hypothetical protein